MLCHALLCRAAAATAAAGVLALCLLGGVPGRPARARPVQLASTGAGGGYWTRSEHDFNPGLPTSPLDAAQYTPIGAGAREQPWAAGSNAAQSASLQRPRTAGGAGVNANAAWQQAQLQAKMGQGQQYVLVPLAGQQQGGASMGQPLALDLDGGEMPMPIDDNNPWPVVPGSNIDMFGHYEPASPRDNPCARLGKNLMFYCDKASGRCGCVAPQPNAQLGFMGGAGIEGGQGNSDSIYGSHDDHSTYGVSGTGWQGPGNGEAPGDLWNPAVGGRQAGLRQKGLRQKGLASSGVSW